MGISDLRQLAVIEERSFDEIEKGVVAVDFNNWIYRYLTVLVRYTDEDVYTTADGIDVLNLLAIIKGVPKFFENGLFPVFVYDGDVLSLKEEEMERRRERRDQAAGELQEIDASESDSVDDERIRSLKAQTQRLTSTHLETSRELLGLLDLPVVDAPAEAEAQAAQMAQAGVVDYVGSEDYDSLLFGAPVTLRKLTGSGDLEWMDLNATLEKHGITISELVDIAILCGTDYNDGVHGVGPKTALKAVKSGESAEDVLEKRNATIPHLEEIRGIFLDPTVDIRASPKTDCTPNMSEVEEYLTEQWEIPYSAIERALERAGATMANR